MGWGKENWEEEEVDEREELVEEISCWRRRRYSSRPISKWLSQRESSVPVAKWEDSVGSGFVASRIWEMSKSRSNDEEEGDERTSDSEGEVLVASWLSGVWSPVVHEGLIVK